ncbi:uncharacterized protein F5891DRAFT_1130422 [Suillus fuscotomentosus]|uniref:CxC1-like cysteine cluster associated with KDZ transposases domain-containing protein n=1 Tax=Suillus fuscotomentosus TaxID=1912939 RepID=A0AAD4HGY0_9AGAM|nr:uncharacterized protein F5891DRAFT_1130422 [Suillus fuscotomentosus]KAG1896097.1 hypothetical protein F5891DRAFT_1130422 [Suillus fuscotomentosus]
MSRTELEHKDDEATIPFSDSLHFSDHPVPRRLTSSQKRANQWRRWSEDIIPRMIVPYLSYIEETLSLRHANIPGEHHSNDGECGTGCRTRSIKVACVLFDAFEEITIIACPCFPAPLQLLRRGLFPCAPMVPSLAVDLRVLKFVRLLFVRQSPNQTAWCDALETFLDGMRYKLTLKNSLRRRFSNVFHWYWVLTVLARDYISTLITDARKDGSCVDQPSEYLCSQCPLCFGGNNWRNEVRGSPSMPNIIVCIDACFTQKCSTNPHGATGNDPLNPTSSFFLPMADVNAMEDFVQRCRGESRQARASRAEPDKDCYEEGMCVPVSVLNGCGDSFIAADEKREKASTRFFTDTGLMALLCRHDRVLWVVNLTSAGEKQHYALALLDRLFEHLPAQMTIGLLYDIGCQLERSCRKWKFMDNSILSRIAFAVAVFHAYGHQWPCQIVYHPRKREGFGLSDSEGCERLWSFLKPLIPSLCVSGFNQRLFVLDTQIRHLDSKSLQGFGHWLHRHWIHCQIKKNGALDSLHDLQVDEHMLRVEWKAQVDYQTKPAPRQSRNKAAEVITTILALEKTLEAQEASIRELEMQLHAALGTEDKVNLEKMKKDVYLMVHLNALAVKTRIRDRLRQRKFEFERLERSYRATINEPGILKLVSTYNGLCYQLRSLIRQRRAPPYAVMPHIIPRDGIFLLDVDDDIWQDVGLDDDTIAPPAWLSDDAVRNGIRLQLEVDRCMEEEAQLMHERAVIQEWMLAEWGAIRGASNNAVWKKKVQCIPCAWPVGESWGPSDEALLQAARDQAQSSFRDEDDAESVEGEEGDCEGDLEYGEIGDEELMDAIEDIALVDEYRYDHSNELLDDTDDIDDHFMPSSPIKLLNKCRCI